MKTIKAKILASITLTVLAAVLITGAAASYMNYISTLDSLEQTLSTAVKIAANQTAATIKSYVNLVKEFGFNAALLSGAPAAQMAQLNDLLKNNPDFLTGGLASAAGIQLDTGEDISSLPAFQAVKSTRQPYVSDPTLMEDTGEMVIYITAPLMKDGQFEGVVMAGLNARVLTDIVSSIQVGSGNAAIYNNKGDTIGFADYDLVLTAYNTQAEAKTDPKLERLAQIEYNMTQGKSGFESYYYGGVEKMMAYCPIPDTNGWSIDIAVVRSEFMKSTTDSIFICIAIMIVTVIAAVFIALTLSRSISRPIQLTARRLEQLAEGDLDSEVPKVRAKDETGLLARSLESTVRDLRTIISDISQIS